MGLLIAFFPSGIPEPIAARGIIYCRIVTISVLQAVQKIAIPRISTMGLPSTTLVTCLFSAGPLTISRVSEKGSAFSVT